MKYEVEVKTLLGDVENAKKFRDRLVSRGAQKGGEGKQLNHYFAYTPDDAEKLIENAKSFLNEEKCNELTNSIRSAQDVSVRTRDADGVVYFVAKISVGDDTSANGVKRIEIQEKVDLSLDELDALLIEAGLEYQAKWSREREEYAFEDVTITLDKNAGYGYVAEFEKEIEDEALLQSAREEIDGVMSLFEVVELEQDRLARMFDFYNKNWREYYGTEKVFTIE